MKKLQSSFLCRGAGVSTTLAFSLREHQRLWAFAALLTPLTVTWLAGYAIGKMFAQRRLAGISAEMATYDSLFEEIALALRRQGVCHDAPRFEPGSQSKMETRILVLRDQIAVQAPCVDLAIAQSQFETLQIETAILHFLQEKRALTRGLLTDTLSYEFHKNKARAPTPN